MKNKSPSRYHRHPYLRKETPGLFTLINRNPLPSKELMSGVEWEEFCKNKELKAA